VTVRTAIAPAVADWRRFGAPSFRVYHYLALCQGVVGILAGFDVVIPFALAIGVPPFAAVLLGILPLAGGMAQLVMPRLLDRTDGNLRGLTVLFAALAEPRGLYFALLAVLAWVGLVQGPLAIVVLAVLVGLTSLLSSMVGSNLLSWYSAVLPEQERRLIVPRMMALSLGVGALLLLPMALMLDALAQSIGVLAYALPFTVSGVLGIAEVVVLRRLRHPGRVIVPPAATREPDSNDDSAAIVDPGARPEFRSFMRVSSLNALGMGFAPSMSVFIISILGLSAGFSMMVGAIGTLTMVVAAAYFGARLARGSSQTMLRHSFWMRATAMAFPLLALPGAAWAPLLMIATTMLASAGFAAGALSSNERLFRLIQGPAVVRQHARYLARTSGAMTVGQMIGAGVLAVGMPLGYPAFAVLYATSSTLRVFAYRLARPAPTVSAVAPMPTQTETAEAGASAVA
jgi:MFS family permease